MSEKDVGQEFLFLMDIDERKQTAHICSDTSILGICCVIYDSSCFCEQTLQKYEENYTRRCSQNLPTVLHRLRAVCFLFIYIFPKTYAFYLISLACRSMVYDKQIFCSFASVSLEKMPARERLV